METIVEVLESAGARALGWTLVHSLWQGLLCFLLGTALLRFIPMRHSALRYATSVGVFGLMVLCSFVTFAVVYAPGVPVAADAVKVFATAPTSDRVATPVAPLYALLSSFNSLLGSRIGLVAALWLIGAMFFLLRIVSGYWYIGFIRRTAEPVAGLWQQRLNALAVKLDIRSVVELAQSNLISAPIVMGYLKPIILVPVGMFSGLTTDQLEAILVHELMHVRRRDYLVNVLQSAMEALYFFNPFAWIMSASIRREREHCCDDGVIARQGNALAYVRALATLEEAKLSRAGLSLSLAEEKNQLLKRIKRIMEKSVHHYSGRDRMIPAVLLVIGLMCASWLTIQSGDRKVMQNRPNHSAAGSRSALDRVGPAAVDTTGKNKTGTYYRYSITTIDEEGKEDVRVVEGYGDEHFPDIASEIEPPSPVEPLEPIDPHLLTVPNYVTPMLPAPNGPPGVLPMVPPVGPMPSYFHSQVFELDTIPQIHGSWHDFGREFEETFKERFEDFYKQHEADLKEMMKELESRFGDDHAAARFEEERMRMSEAHTQDREWARGAEEFARRSEALQHENLFRMEEAQHAMELARMQSKFDEAHVADMEAELQRLNESVKLFEQRLHEAQAKVQEEAIKDGYLKKDETINSINMNNDGMEINGKKVKPADARRYREIMDAGELHPGRRE